ncbi:hypothetical protein AND_000239 [Anopheles darlingi]|uniref:Uncharacterized protein n=1 Tax=Anopheles darlingi TaxID=43151 RepID=W5JUX5_ANODA|nr:hypothetical protein AND_000239 [Anopheles darlingi]
MVHENPDSPTSTRRCSRCRRLDLELIGRDSQNGSDNANAAWTNSFWSPLEAKAKTQRQRLASGGGSGLMLLLTPSSVHRMLRRLTALRA